MGHGLEGSAGSVPGPETAAASGGGFRSTGRRREEIGWWCLPGGPGQERERSPVRQRGRGPWQRVDGRPVGGWLVGLVGLVGLGLVGLHCAATRASVQRPRPTPETRTRTGCPPTQAQSPSSCKSYPRLPISPPAAPLLDASSRPHQIIMAATLGPPSIAHLRTKSSFSSLSDSASLHNDTDPSSTPRFPHTHAQLAAIARLYKPDAFLGDPDGDQNISPSLVARVVALLDAEREDELKGLLKDMFGPITDDEVRLLPVPLRRTPLMTSFLQLEQHVLDLMHKHRDDIDNVPFLFLTPTRRPISRPSSRASTHSARLIPNRPDTPNSAPSSPLAMIFRRPHTPLSSPLGTSGPQPASYMSGRSESPGASPIITHAQFAVSLPSSPMLSPRLLNAKASEFKPIPRPLSAASSNPGSLAALRGETPSPDLWAPPSRPTSKLAIAAPLTPDSSLLHRAGTPNSSLRSSMRPDDDDDDPFDPFAARAFPRSFHPSTSDDLLWGNSPISASSLSPDDSPFPQVFGSGMDHNGSSHESTSRQSQDDDMDPEMAAMLTDGMTPFDVLSSVFGATLAPSELEEALAANGYDFERAMTWLVDRSMASHPSPAQPRVQPVGNRVMLVQRDGHGVRGGRAAFHGPQGRSGGRFANGRPVQGGNRVCRYFLAGECLRADCRFRSGTHP